MDTSGEDTGAADQLPKLTPWTFWAKWSSAAVGTWHPLLFHLLDVAVVAEALWDEVLSPARKEWLAEAMGLDPLAARSWITFLAGLHDLGKACPGFQFQLHLLHIEDRIRAAGLPVEAADWVPHGAVSAIALREILPQHFGVSTGVAHAVATAVGGHHGVFPSAADLNALQTTSVGRTAWRLARARYAEWLSTTLQVPRDRPPTAMDHPAAMVFAGFVSVADWIGSAEGFFHHGVSAPDALPTCDLLTYAAQARQCAREALEALGWTGWTPPQEAAPFAHLFPGITPRPLQQAAIDLAPRLQGPALVVIEAPMGEGKTEAAMYLADYWGAQLGQRGIYFALPTQATSNQMFQRVLHFLGTRYPHDVVNLQLLHGHAALSAVFEELREQGRHLLAPDQIYGPGRGTRPQSDGGVIAAEWFAAGKRALLAPFGVGTVDQALLASLQVMHVFVRLFGLSTKTVILDEVHAYDTYMSSLLERLLEWLGALGAPVLLLSATLPSARRRRLLDAYARGAGWPPAEEAAGGVAYPRLTWATGQGHGAQHVGAAQGRSQRVALEWVAVAAPREPGVPFLLAERLRDALAEGGCAVVMCNTVGRAQEVYQALKPYFPGLASDGLPMLDLFHARFLFEDRDAREQRSVQRFGLRGPRPEKAILVATQVVEQSLDLDFDLMVTDMAPVDLVLQRAGRLHRHDRRRPPRLREPRLLVATPEAVLPGGIPRFDPGSEAVYLPHILLRTWLLLRRRSAIHLPEDIASLVEGVYSVDECPSEASPELAAYWLTTLARMRAQEQDEAQQAHHRYIKHPHFGGELARVVELPREEDAPELHPAHQALTRLTEPTVQVVCLAGTPEQPRLGPDGGAVDLATKPDLPTIRALLRRSVSITSRRVVFDLLAAPVPEGWQKSALLRQHRTLFLDAQGVAVINRWQVRLDPELGVVVETARGLGPAP